MLPLAVVVAVGSAAVMAVGTEASTSASDEATGTSVMIHSADPSFSTTEKEKLREICGLGGPIGRYRSTIMCDSAEAAHAHVKAIMSKSRDFAGSLNPSDPVPNEMMPGINRSVVTSIISTNTGVSEREVKKVLDELDRVNLKNAERAREGSEISRRGGMDTEGR
jgi:hypothetical protein